MDFKRITLSFFLSFILLSNWSIAQENKIKSNKRAQFPGGDTELVNYIHTHKRIPNSIINGAREGVVTIKFTIDTSGKAINPFIVKGLYPDADSDAIRTISEMPLWKPKNSKGINIDDNIEIEIYYFMDRNSDFYYNRGINLFNQGKFEDALLYFRFALSLNSRDKDAAQSAGICCVKINQTEAACKFMKMARLLGCSNCNLPKLFNCLEIDTLSNVRIGNILALDTFSTNAYYEDGFKELNIYINQYFRYPKFTDDVYKSYYVVASVFIDSDGYPRDAYIHSKLNKAFELEMIRLYSTLPRFKPATRNGKNVPSIFKIYYNIQPYSLKR